MQIESIALSQTFQLESDPETEVIIRQATEGENIERDNLFSKTRWVNDGIEVLAEQDINLRAIRRKEAYLTLGRVTGITIKDAKGNIVDLFKSKEDDSGPSVRKAMSEREFNIAWDRLPREVAEEIGNLVHKVNIDWSAGGSGE